MPAEKPQYLVVIFIDEPSKVKYGGVIAAPVFKSCLLYTSVQERGQRGEDADAVILPVAADKGGIKADVARRAGAVSYTHLDVYKRQPLGFALALGFPAKKPDSMPERVNVPVS